MVSSSKKNLFLILLVVKKIQINYNNLKTEIINCSDFSSAYFFFFFLSFLLLTMWMFDLLPYILVAWHSAFLTRSWAIPVAIYTLVQFTIIRPIGYGWVTDLQGDIFYTTTFMVFALLGRAMACATKIHGVMERFISTHEPGERIEWAEDWGHYFWRVLFKVLLMHVILIIAATLPYELIPKNLWFGFVITVVVLCLIDVLFWAIFYPSKVPPDSFGLMFYKDVAFKFRPVGRLTMLILFIVFDVVVTLVFCIVETATMWEQFYLAACIAGAFLIEVIIVAIIYHSIKDYDKLPLKTLKEKAADGTEVDTGMPVGYKRN